MFHLVISTDNTLIGLVLSFLSLKYVVSAFKKFATTGMPQPEHIFGLAFLSVFKCLPHIFPPSPQ